MGKEHMSPFEEPLFMTEEFASMAQGRDMAHVDSSRRSTISELRLKHEVGHFRAEMNALMGSALETSQNVCGTQQRLTAAESMLVESIQLQQQLALAINELQSRMDF